MCRLSLHPHTRRHVIEYVSSKQVPTNTTFHLNFKFKTGTSKNFFLDAQYLPVCLFQLCLFFFVIMLQVPNRCQILNITNKTIHLRTKSAMCSNLINNLANPHYFPDQIYYQAELAIQHFIENSQTQTEFVG